MLSSRAEPHVPLVYSLKTSRQRRRAFVRWSFQPTIIPDAAGQYVAQLIANNGTRDSDPATTTVVACNAITDEELAATANDEGWLSTLQHAQSIGFTQITAARSCPGSAIPTLAALTNADGNVLVAMYEASLRGGFLVLPFANGSFTVFNETGGVQMGPNGFTQMVGPDGVTPGVPISGPCADYLIYLFCKAGEAFETVERTQACIRLTAIASPGIGLCLELPTVPLKAACILGAFAVAGTVDPSDLKECVVGNPEEPDPDCDSSNTNGLSCGQTACAIYKCRVGLCNDVNPRLDGTICAEHDVCNFNTCQAGECTATATVPKPDYTDCQGQFAGVPKCAPPVSIRDGAVCFSGTCTPTYSECPACEICSVGESACDDVHTLSLPVSAKVVTHLFSNNGDPYCIGTLQCNIAAEIDAYYYDCSGTTQVGWCTGSDYEVEFNWTCGESPCNAAYVLNASMDAVSNNCRNASFPIDPSFQPDPWAPNGQVVWSIPNSRQACCVPPS